uniref:pyrimidine-specific ribonucleoside hydrolase RihB-like n=1 Tax=Styela clava TaxID=7725 RepID=UPI00193A6FE3|nr:pyrimidine-specific ribonucleoside hydrolase RihB-like [Styela clava]
MEPEKYLLIDCDPGVDDCFAIMMALTQRPKIKIVAITCVNGNVGIKQVAINAVRVVKVCEMLDQVPIYQGCADPVLLMPGSIDSSFYHGKDGMGDVPDIEPRSDENLLRHVQDEHAVNAIIRLSKKYEGKLQILAIGPLTNVALATRLDPDLPKRLKSVHILGGTIRGHGNVTPCSEYNFFTDPEAAQMVLRGFSHRCPVQILTYEVTTDHPLPPHWFDDLLEKDSAKCNFFREVYKTPKMLELEDISAGISTGYIICDAYIVSVVLRPDCIIKSRKLRMGVELGGNLARGSLVIDHKSKGSPHLTEGAIELIEEIDVGKFKELVAETLA